VKAVQGFQKPLALRQPPLISANRLRVPPKFFPKEPFCALPLDEDRRLLVERGVALAKERGVDGLVNQDADKRSQPALQHRRNDRVVEPAQRAVGPHRPDMGVQRLGAEFSRFVRRPRFGEKALVRHGAEYRPPPGAALQAGPLGRRDDEDLEADRGILGVCAPRRQTDAAGEFPDLGDKPEALPGLRVKDRLWIFENRSDGPSLGEKVGLIHREPEEVGNGVQGAALDHPQEQRRPGQRQTPFDVTLFDALRDSHLAERL